MKTFLVILAAVSCSWASDRTTGGFIGKLLSKGNATAQAIIEANQQNNDRWLEFGGKLAAAANEATASVSDKVSAQTVNVLSDMEDVAMQGMGMVQNAGNEFLNLVNQTPVIGKFTKLPNQIVSEIINGSVSFGKSSTQFLTGAGQVGAAFATSTTSQVADKMTAATHSVIGKLSQVNGKLSHIASVGVSKGIGATSNAIQGLGNTLENVGKWIENDSKLPSDLKA